MKITFFLPLVFTITLLSFNTNSEELLPKSGIEWSYKTQMCQNIDLNGLGIGDIDCPQLSEELVNKCVSKLPEQFPESMLESGGTFLKCVCDIYASKGADMQKMPDCLSSSHNKKINKDT
ncbi:MAG: hypothetical protein ACI9T7_001201 [Oleiphilaceae bacterium]|jgi:hypothetical protein